MSMPPQGGWQPPQPPGPPPNQGQPYGQPITPSGYNPEQPPPGRHQGPWQPQPGPPPQEGNGLKWLLIAVAILLVIGISVGATLIFTRGDGGGGGTATSTSGAPSDIASANDTGPVSIITDEPTCQSYLVIGNSLADVEAKGWGAERAALGPASEWTPDERSHVQAVATAMRSAADQVAPLVKQTPHRLVRELYEQFIAYGRAYADSVQDYVPRNNELASASVNTGAALVGICNAITYGAASRAVAVEPASAPTEVGAVGDPAKPLPFVTESDSACTGWIEREEKLTADTPDWQDVDMGLPATQWTPERRATEERVRPILAAFADDLETAGRQSGNPTLEDFALASALYINAYVSVGDSYNGSADGWLSYTGLRIANSVTAACSAAAR
jgi:hypothetical protein